MSLFFSTTPNPSSQEEGTTGSDFSSIILILTHPRTACECPSSDFCLRTPVFFCPDCQRMPRSFFSGRRPPPAPPKEGSNRVCPYGWMHLFHHCPSFRMKKHRFRSPKLHFRCISNTLQRYEKILKLTNCKHKIFKNFSSARLYCYVSSSCKNLKVKY